MTESANLPILHNSPASWALALCVAVIAWFGLRWALKWLARHFGDAADTESLWDDALVKLAAGTWRPVLLVVAVYLGSRPLTLGAGTDAVLGSALALALILQVGLWANSLLLMWLRHNREERLETDPSSIAAINAMGFIARVLLWSVTVLLILDNLGVNITALVAGLGVGGIAVALAVQNILGDLFASLSIALDKPFAIGDFLIIDSHLGSVEHIGLKTTRLRSLSGEQLVFSNTDLLGSRIKNYGRMYQRRVMFQIGVTYQTARASLERIPGIIREAVEAQQEVRFDRSHFQSHGDFALVFETVYYVLGPDYNLYMDIQQAINLAIHARFEEEGIDFAYPTQTIHLTHSATPADAVG